MRKYKLAKGHRLVTYSMLFITLMAIIRLLANIITKTDNEFDIVLVCITIILLLFLIFFFRDPDRNPDIENDSVILAPADGILFEIDSSSENSTIIFRIRMRFWDVHVNYMPIKGVLIDQFKKRGTFLPILPGLNKISKHRNARQIMTFTSFKGFSFKIVQISGIFAYRTVSYLKKGDVTDKGDRIGMIRFGSETDLYFPTSKIERIIVKTGVKVTAGQTVIAMLK